MTLRACRSGPAVAGLVVLVLAASGCAHPARQRLIGTWQVTFEMTQAELDEMTPNDNPFVAALGQVLMRTLRAEMQWEFRGDGTMSATGSLLGSSFTRAGTWKFLSGTAEATTISAQFEGEAPRELTFRFPDEDTLEAAPYVSGRWQLNRVVRFKRVPPDSG